MASRRRSPVTPDAAPTAEACARWTGLRARACALLAWTSLGIAVTSGSAGFAGVAQGADAQAAAQALEPNSGGYPDKAITLLVGANPGGGWDQLARLIQQIMMTEGISPVPVEVINRGGAGGTIGLTELVTRHRRDPYMLMIGGSTLASASISHGSRFTMLDSVPLARIVSEYDVVAVPTDSPFQSMEALTARLRSDPESVVWGGGSAASIDHILVGLIAQAAGVDPRRITYVAFAGGGEASAAVMGGQVTAGVSGLAEWKSLAEAGRMRLLAISSAQRLDGIDVPTLREAGLDVVVENWRSLMLPPGVRNSEKEWLLSAIESLRASEDWTEVLERFSWTDRFLAGPEFESFLREEMIDTAKILQDLGLGLGGKMHTSVGPYVFPTVALGGVFCFGSVMGWQAFRRRRLQLASGPEEGPDEVDSTTVSWKRFSAAASASLAYILLMPVIGFIFVTPLFLVVQSRIIGSRKPGRDGCVGILLTLAAAAIFTYVLNVELP